MNRAVPLSIALALIGAAAWALSRDHVGITHESVQFGRTPARLYAPPASLEDASGSADRPLVIVAHGFAGSQRLMEPIALHLAGRGYQVLTFDFLGHGQHPDPFSGALQDQEGAARVLIAQTLEVVQAATARYAGVSGFALVGHSMATNILIRVAQELEAETTGAPVATVGISMYAPTIEAGSPANVLAIAGAFESRLLNEGRRVVALSGGMEPESVQLGARVGTFEDGSARAVLAAPRVEHVGVLYSGTTLKETGDWLDAAFQFTPVNPEMRAVYRGRWILALLLSLPWLVWSLVPRLPSVTDHVQEKTLTLRTLSWVAGVPAIVTPILLRPFPTGFLPVVVADYLAIHFLVFGLVMGGVLWWLAGRPRGADLWDRWRAWVLTQRMGAALVAVSAVLGGFYVVLVLPLDLVFTAFMPIPERLPIMLAMLAGTLPFFLVDEWLTRGEGVPRGAYGFTKGLFLLSLGIAVAIDLSSLFFLVIILPVILIFFAVHGFFSRWIYRATGSPFVAAVGNAVAFAWAMGVTFPMYVVGG